MSSLASLAAVTNNTRTSGTTVVNQDREEIWGIIWTTHTQTHTQCKIHENTLNIHTLNSSSGILFLISDSQKRRPAACSCSVSQWLLCCGSSSTLCVWQRDCLANDEAISCAGYYTSLISLHSIHSHPVQFNGSLAVQLQPSVILTSRCNLFSNASSQLCMTKVLHG